MLSILFFLTFINSQAATSTSTADENMFQQGLAAYQNKQYAEARDDFQKLLEKSKDSSDAMLKPNLLHNLALSAYQMDQKPLALALWRKALYLRPGFALAIKGRDSLESKMQMRPFERDSLNLWAERRLEIVSIYELLWLSAGLLFAVGWLWIRYMGERKSVLEEERPLPAFPTLPCVLSFLLLVFVILVTMKGKELLTTRATIVSPKVSARSLPTDESVGLFDLSGGSEVLVRRRQSGWTQVENSDQANGWVKDGEIFITSGGG